VVFDEGDIGEQPLSMEVMIQHAVRSARIESAVQPIVELCSGRVVAEEGLARITDPQLGVLSAAAFLDVAEQLRLMHMIDSPLLRAAAARLGLVAAAAPPRQFVNLSGDLLRHPALIAELAEALPEMDRSGPPGLILTLSERQIPLPADEVAAALAPLLERGCGLALADYGGSASSNRLLSRLPVGFVAIDPELCRLAGESRRARVLLGGIARTAHELEQTTIARGVEEEAALRTLIELGIDWGQGFLFGAPRILDARSPAG
jgi:EAL domain-containing protein (putative c-di-GMP-specific phosphodiesterase class I)